MPHAEEAGRGAVPTIAARTGEKPNMVGQSIRFLGLAIVAGVVGLILVFGSWYTINQTERGVLLRNGAYVATLQPGLGFKIPLFEKVVKISTQTHTWTWDKVNSYSADQQPADLKVSVTFHVEPTRVADLYSRFGDLDSAVDRLLSPHVNQELKVVFGQYTAVRAIQERAKLNADAMAAIAASLTNDPMIVLEGVQIENIDFSPQYIASVEQRMQAEVEVQKLEQNAQREKIQAQIVVIQAQAQADAVLANAKAQADAIKLKGDAEAAAIRAKGEALKENPALVGLTQAERWNGVLPTTMVPGGALPMLTIGEARKD